MRDLALIEASELAITIERARAALDDGDLQRALLLSSGAYAKAKAAGAYAESVQASRTLVDKARRLQADALKIEALAYCAMADAVDEAQDKGEIGRTGRPKSVSDENTFTLEEVGIDRQHLHHARKLRNAERAEPGFVARVIEDRLSDGDEPSRAFLKKSAGHAVGTKTATMEERGDDLYETPVEAMHTLLALESFSGDVIEPSVGRGAILRPLEDAGYAVAISDAVDRGIVTKEGECQGVADFLKTVCAVDGWDIVTNPPYGVANAYIAHALREFRPGKMAMLLNLNFLAGFDDPDRCYVMDENPPSRVYVFTRRLPMMHRDGWDGPKASSQMNTAWFIWERNEDGSYGRGYPQIIRVDWKAFEASTPLLPGAGGHVAPLGFVPDAEFARDTPRKTLDERVDENIERAFQWMKELQPFDNAILRRQIGVRDSVAVALIDRFSANGLIAKDEDGLWRLTPQGVSAVVDVNAAIAVRDWRAGKAVAA